MHKTNYLCRDMRGSQELRGRVVSTARMAKLAGCMHIWESQCDMAVKKYNIHQRETVSKTWNVTIHILLHAIQHKSDNLNKFHI